MALARQARRADHAAPEPHCPARKRKRRQDPWHQNAWPARLRAVRRRRPRSFRQRGQDSMHQFPPPRCEPHAASRPGETPIPNQRQKPTPSEKRARLGRPGTPVPENLAVLAKAHAPIRPAVGQTAPHPAPGSVSAVPLAPSHASESAAPSGLRLPDALPSCDAAKKLMHQFPGPRRDRRRNRRRRALAVEPIGQNAMHLNAPRMDCATHWCRLVWWRCQKPMHQFPRPPRSLPRRASAWTRRQNPMNQTARGTKQPARRRPPPRQRSQQPLYQAVPTRWTASAGRYRPTAQRAAGCVSKSAHTTTGPRVRMG